MRTLPILFLDIDGVLNSEAWYRRRTKQPWSEEHEIDPEALFLLEAVVEMSCCEVVVSSSWSIGRSLKELQSLLPAIPIIGMTPILTTGTSRGAEIDMWLQAHPDSIRFAVVDASGDIYAHQNHVRTSWKIGLTPHEARQLVSLLKFGAP